MPTPETALAVLAGIYAVDLGWRILAPRIKARCKEARFAASQARYQAERAARLAEIGPPAPAPADLEGLVAFWPKADMERMCSIRRVWDALSATEQAEALRNAPLTIHEGRMQGRLFFGSLRSYLAERRWTYLVRREAMQPAVERVN